MAFVFSACAIISFLCFFNCGGAAALPKADTPEVGAPEEIIGLSVNLFHMSRYSAVLFSLRDDGGEIMFSCNFFTSDGEEFKLKNVSVPSEYMQRLRDMAKQHGFAQMKERDRSNMPTAVDAPMYETVMYWPGKKRLRLNYWPAQAELEKFFWELADACVNKPGAPEDISALYYTYVHDNDFNYFRFEINACDGEFLFTARCFTEDDDKVVFHDVPVNATDMERLREIVKKHGIENMKGNPLREGRSAPDSPYTLLNIYWPDMRILRLRKPEIGAEELENFFRDLALAKSEHWHPTNVPEYISWLDFRRTSDIEADSFIFSLREVSAAKQLFAQYINEKGEKISFFEYVDPKYMDQLREIVKKHGLVDLAKSKEQKSAAGSYVLNMDWWDDPSLQLEGLPESAGEELEKFFRSLADRAGY